jgi:murein DD-endopeptidase MepM/ murein hydrolase activator NlpD
MRKNYFIVVVAHSIHGRIRRIHVPHYIIHVVLSLAVFGAIVGIGLLSSYARMLWKVAEFNKLRSEKVALQKQYDELRQTVSERNIQLASLGNLASEVSIAFGIKRDFVAGSNLMGESPEMPRYRSSLNQFGLLQQVELSTQASNSMWQWLENTTPSIWPVQGSLSSPFGKRLDPFLGKGAFHSGIDLTADYGAPVVATADGTVSASGWYAGFGKRVVLEHGHNGLSTVYGHLSDFFVRPGQVVRQGEVIGRIGSTGRATGSHLHYEVRYRGTSLNPYKFLQPKRRQTAGFSLAD